MKTVFFGTPEFALPTLELLIQQTTVQAVVTQPDRPSGRGGKLTPSPVKRLAQEYEIPVYQPERLRRDPQVLDVLEHLEADFFIVVAYGQILNKRVLAMPTKGCINVHGSLLPQYRGAAPVQWAIYHGARITGITTMLMDAGLDTGPMLLKQTVPIDPQSTSEDLLRELSQIGAQLLITTLEQFEQLIPEPQIDTDSSYAPLITPEHLKICWDQPAIQIQRQIRAFYPEVFTIHRGQRLRVLASEVLLGVAPVGVIQHIERRKGFGVGTPDGVLLVTQVQPTGKKPQSAWDYINGSRLEPGEVLGMN